MKYKKYLSFLSVSIFAVSALMLGSFNYASAGFWDWFGIGSGSQQAQVNVTTYKWVNNGLVSESSGRNTGTCAKQQVTTYTCSSSNVGAKLYDGTNRGASYGDVGHAWPIYEGENTSVAAEYTYSGCGLDKRTGGQVNQWECKASNVTTNSSPVINGIPAIPVGIKVGQSVSFGWAATDADSDDLSWSVEWGDKTGIAGACAVDHKQNKNNWNLSTSHSWGNPGTYTVRAVASDCRGGSNENLFSVDIGNSSSSSSTSGILSATTGYADHSSTNATLHGTINNPNKENFYYYFNYRKETESSTQTKQTSIVYHNNSDAISYNVASAIFSGLTPGTKYVYRLYAYSYTTGKTVSGELKSFTTLNSSNSSSLNYSYITVLSPNGGVWAKNTNIIISWYITPFSDKNFGINLLYDNGNLAANIRTCSSSSTIVSSNGIDSYNWKAGFDANNKEIPNGKYKILVYDCAGGTASGYGNSFDLVSINSSSNSSNSNPHAEWSLVSTSAYGSAGVAGVASSSVTGTITLKAKAIGGSMIKPSAKDFSVAFSGTYMSNGIDVNPVVTVSPIDPIVGEGGEYTAQIVGVLYSNDPRFVSSQPVFMAIKDIDSVVGDVGVMNQTWGDTFRTSSVQLTKEGSSSSSSSTSGVLSAVTGRADYSTTNATLYGTVNNPNREEVYYYFNYRKDTESSSATKQTAWGNINSGSFMNVSSPIEGLSPGTKYVYRLYAYNATDGGKTVSGDLKSFTTLSSSGSSSSSSKPFVKIFSPNGGEGWRQGTTQRISYQNTAGYPLRIDLVKGILEKKYVVTIGNTSNNSDFTNWTVSGAPGNDYFIRIGSEIGSIDYEFSDAPFSILPAINFLPLSESSSSNNTNTAGQTSNYTFSRELGYGSSGNDVAELQKRLTSEGYYSGPITGYYGSMTGEAVKKYQANNGITVTGYVGPQTLAVLNGSSASSINSSSSSQEVSLSQLVELFISLGIIPSDKADLVRASIKGM